MRIEKFGLGQPRIVSRYPKLWKRLVWEAFQSDNDLERTRMTELVARLSKRMIRRRNHVWQAERTWIQNAHQEHKRVPFHAVLSRLDPTEHPRTVTGEDPDDSTILWKVPRGLTVARSASQMADSVSAMLRIAQVIIFVDPYFRPADLRHQRPLEAFLCAVLEGRPCGEPQRIEVHTSLDRDDAPAWTMAATAKQMTSSS